MASRNLYFNNLILIIAMFFITGLTPLWTQTSDYYMELRFIQRLKWVGDEYTMRYEIVIQREERGQYRTALREFTEASFIEVSLHPGKYRFQVIPYDYLGKPVPVTEWMNFEVLPGVASGLNNQLIPGDHEIVVVNPSGGIVNRAEVTLPKSENAAEGEKAVEYITETEHIYDTEKTGMRQFDIYAGAAYVPLLPIYGENQLFGENVSAFGMAARLCAVLARQSFLNPGMELAASWRVYGSGGQAEQATAFDFNILAQSRFPGGRAALNLRAGAGLSLLPKTQSASPDGQYSIHANIGASFLWLFMKNLYLEGGIDYSQFFTKDNFGFFRPWLGLGYRF
jgi:hypothetical protein